MKKLLAGCFWTFVVVGIVASLVAPDCMHEYTPDDCTKDSTCNLCGETREARESHNIVDASCTKEKHCLSWGCSFVEGKPLGHLVESWTTVEPTCNSSGKRYGDCSRCNQKVEEKIDKLTHVPGTPTVTKEATLSQKGEKVRYCKLCNELLETIEFELTAQDKQEIFSDFYFVDELLDILHTNSYRAEQTLQDEYIQLAGILDEIDSDGKYYTLEAFDQWNFGYGTIHCRFGSADQKSIIMQKNRGDAITINCQITSIGETLGYTVHTYEIIK